MTTYRELVYIVIDLAKLISDDSTLNENHVAYLLDRYRTYLLEQKYKNNNYGVPINNVQEYCSMIKLIPAKQPCDCGGMDCLSDDSNFLLKSVNKIPNLLNVGTPIVSYVRFRNCTNYELYLTTTWTKERVDTVNEFFGKEVITSYDEGVLDKQRIYEGGCLDEATKLEEILSQPKYGLMDANSFWKLTEEPNEDCDQVEGAKARALNNVSMVSINRFPYAGTSKYFKNKIYGTLGYDHYLYLKSNMKDFYEDTEENRVVYINGVFESPKDALSESCNTGLSDSHGNECIAPNGYNKCEPLDNPFPIEDSLVTQLIALVLNAIRQNIYNPRDRQNNANDDLSSIESFVRQFMKDRYVKGNEGDYDGGTVE